MKKIIQFTLPIKKVVLATLLVFTVYQAKAALFVNEINGNDNNIDWVEIYNNGADPVDLSGYTIEKTDELGMKTPFTIPAGSTIAAGGYKVWERNAASSFTWGISAKKAVTIKLLDKTGKELSALAITEADVASTLHSEGLDRTVGRETDGAGKLVVFRNGGTKEAANNGGIIQIPTPESERKKLYVNEISGNEKWLEIYNAGDEEIDLTTGYSVQKIDEAGAIDNFFFEGGVKIAAGGYRSWKQLDPASFTWGISGKKDVAFKIFDPNGTMLDYFEVRESLYSEGLSRTVGRETDGAGKLVVFRNGGTKEAANNGGIIQIPTPKSERKKLYVNEISGNEKWIEICNAGNEKVDLTGYAITKIDENGSIDNWFIPDGTEIAAKGFMHWTQAIVVDPLIDVTTYHSFTWGISAKKDVTFKISDQNGTELNRFEVTMPDMFSEGQNQTVGRIPDATGSLVVIRNGGTPGAENAPGSISTEGETGIDNAMSAFVENKTLYLSGNVTSVSIVSVLGANAITQNNVSGSIDLSTLPAGVYLVKMLNKKQQKVQKINLGW